MNENGDDLTDDDEESFSISPDEIMALTEEDMVSMAREETRETISLASAAEMLDAPPDMVSSWAEAEGVVATGGDMDIAPRLPRNWVLEKILERRHGGQLVLSGDSGGPSSLIVKEQRVHMTREVSGGGVPTEAFCEAIDRVSRGRHDGGAQNQWVAAAIMVGAAFIVIALLVGVIAIVQGLHSVPRASSENTMAMQAQLIDLQRRLDESQSYLAMLQTRADDRDAEEVDALWDEIRDREVDVADMRAEIARLRALLTVRTRARNARDMPPGTLIEVE